MSGSRPESIIDPVCGMTVKVARVESEGLLLERGGRTYAFCSAGCRRAFAEDPDAYVEASREQAAATAATVSGSGGLPLIDDGMRRWYESCSCCLSEAFPEVKAALDAERAEQRVDLAGPGICEVAEAHADHEGAAVH